ncbi:unnamed protein product [Linum tenue]|uniref:Uncharacterized protein n=1 Tax=Linum tenue TaxID=586396 RepID=A0AAV0GYI2_9ROSI|nr:unnamed protein product [Linum tenue]
MPMTDSPCTIAATASWSSDPGRLVRARRLGQRRARPHGSPRPLLNHFPKEGVESASAVGRIFGGEEGRAEGNVHRETVFNNRTLRDERAGVQEPRGGV